MIKRENYKQIIKFLKGKFIMPKCWLDKIEKTVKLWNSQGFFHQDLHERNIIIDPNDDVYIIDYGEAQISNQSPASSTDLNVVFSYQYLTQNKEEDRQQEKSELFNNLKTFYHKLLADKSWRDIEQQITSAADDERAQLSIIKFVAQRRQKKVR